MTEENHRRWDVAIKVAGFVGVIASLLIGIYQFQDARRRELKQFAESKEREFYSEFWNERLRLYIKTLDTTAAISKADTQLELERTIKDFRLLFDGSMTVVQDPVVDRAMHEFDQLVSAVEAGDMKADQLGIHSYELGRTCYKSLRDSWNKPFNATEDTTIRPTSPKDE